ncbi:MAG: hypothetical protein EBY39_11470 [Flavobacteriia bacterium]|nr:hypothetical protein [Flavobacteriia bacterium]
MESIIFRGPINQVSFGNVSYNLLRELYRSGVEVAFFPIGEQLNFDSFDKIDEKLKQWIISSAQNRFHIAKKDMHTLSQWHITGSELRVSPEQTLFTFYETDQPTLVEKSIVDLQDNCIFSSSHAESKFKEIGCNNVHSVPIGFDEDLVESDEEYLPEKIHFGLMGKFEKRKNTAQIIKNWAKKYGNNYKYQLSCCITNPFFKPEQMNGIIAQVLEGQSYGNINFLPFLKTNSEVNEFLNAIDIDLTGLSGAEGWNLPAFNATALGKWSIVMDHTSHKDWANKDNCILIEPELLSEIYDQTFFHKGQPFNQGNMNTISDSTMIEAFETSEKFYGKKNTEGVKLRNEYKYSNTLTQILKIIQNDN